MAKKSNGKTSKPRTDKDADYHRKMANQLSAKARIHSAKADLMEAQNPSKKKPTFGYM